MFLFSYVPLDPPLGIWPLFFGLGSIEAATRARLGNKGALGMAFNREAVFDQISQQARLGMELVY